MPEVPILRRAKDKPQFYADASILPFILDECIAHGAVDIAIDGDRYSIAIRKLPDVYQSRVIELKNKKECYNKTLAILEPMCAETGFILDFGERLKNRGKIKHPRMCKYHWLTCRYHSMNIYWLWITNSN